MREAQKVATEVAKEMVREKSETLLAGSGGRDIFSLLGNVASSPFDNFIDHLAVKANMDTEAKNKLTEEELLSQMRYVAWFDPCPGRTTDDVSTILLAGHETTSNSLSWTLMELARHPDMQSRLRAEIRRTEAAIQARGEAQFTLADFDEMPYTTAVIKVHDTLLTAWTCSESLCASSLGRITVSPSCSSYPPCCSE